MKVLKVLGSFVGCLIILAVFVLWTEYAYENGITQAVANGCEISARQIN